MVDQGWEEFPIFNDLDPGVVEKIVSMGTRESISARGIIFEESSPTKELYIILSGRVRVEIDSVDRGEPIELAVLRKGEAFGEIAFIEGGRRTARTRAVDDVRLLKIDRDRLLAFFEADPKAGYIFMRNLARLLARRIEDINFFCRNYMGAQH